MRFDLAPTTVARRLRDSSSAILVLIAGAAWAQASIPGYPDTIDAFDAREVALLPPYCPYTHYFRAKVPGGADRDRTEHWRLLLGDTFEHVHHYCFALMKTNRALLLARSRESRSFYLNDSILEFDYVIDRSPPEFVLLPEILTKKGDNLFVLGKGPLAILMMERAIEFKPDYWPAHAKLADHYKSTGEVQKARTQLEAGLKAAPGTSALMRRLAELGASEARTK